MSFDRLFADRLKEERGRTGLTQADLAEIASISREMLGKYERGAAEPGVGVLMDLDRAGVDVLYLVTGRRTPRDPGTLSEAEAALIARYRSGSPALRGYLQELGQAPASGSNAVTIGGDVGQQVNGDQTVTAPMTFNVGSKPRKN